jgi:hypothetical protein
LRIHHRATYASGESVCIPLPPAAGRINALASISPKDIKSEIGAMMRRPTVSTTTRAM